MKQPILTAFTFVLLIGFGISMAMASPQSFAQRADVSAFIDRMVKKHNFERNQLVDLFNKVEIQTNVLESVSKPFESKPWHVYRNIMVTQSKIDSGVAFWKQHESALERAELTYGVPANILVAVLGVETNFGQNQGSYLVLDTLATLAFEYPRRAKFFNRELEQFLLLTREQNMEPRSVYGSYAGAIGQAQFIPSSYRHYAVDFTGNGRIDLRHDTVDAIGSIANFLKLHGWEAGAPVTVPAEISGVQYQNINTKQRKPSLSVKQLKTKGITPHEPSISEDLLASLIALRNEESMEYWLGFNNFYVITRYNTSEKYAMAVYQLAEEIHQARG